MGLEVYLVTDAIFTNEPNTAPALDRLIQARVVPLTDKSLLFEIDEKVGRDALPEAWRRRMESESSRGRVHCHPSIG